MIIMAKDIRLLLMTRHGVKDDRKMLVPESAVNMYHNAGGFLRKFVTEHNVQPEEVTVRHSNQVRTKHTADAILAGAYDLLPEIQPTPDLNDKLENLQKSLEQRGLEFYQHSALSYQPDIKFNSDAYGQDEKLFMGEWVGGPDRDNIAGVPNTPFNEVRQRAKTGLTDVLSNMLTRARRVGLIVTHGGIIESLAMDVVQSVHLRKLPVDSLFQIGGYFPQEDYAAVFLERSNPAAIPKARLVRYSDHNGTERCSYTFHLDNLLEIIE